MVNTSAVRITIAALAALVSTCAIAQSNRAERDCVYDYRLLKDSECRAYRMKVLRAKSDDERHALRGELARLMESRARQREISVDDWRGLDVTPVSGSRTR